MPLQPIPQQEYARVIFIIILLFFIWTSPDQPTGFNGVHDYVAERIARTKHALDVLNTTKWQDFSPKGGDKPAGEPARYLNLTGFREEDDYAWERLDAFKKRSLEFSHDAIGRYHQGRDVDVGRVGDIYDNVTGIVHGKWTRHTADLTGEPRNRSMNLTETAPHIHWAFRDEQYWKRNITGTEGKMMVRMEERHIDEADVPVEDGSSGKMQTSMNLVRQVGATVTIQDESSSGDGWNMKLHGIHWPVQGVILLTTTSEKFQGIFGLPHLTSDMSQFLTSQTLLNRTTHRTLRNMQRIYWADQGNPWSATPNAQNDAFTPAPACELVIYLQVYPLRVGSSGSAGYLEQSKVINQIEQELRYPNGAPIPEPPALQMSAVLFSPDCGFMLETMGPPAFAPGDGEHLLGMKQEVWVRHIQYWLHVFSAVIFAQIWLLKMQSKESSTPSTVGRVSLYTIGMMVLADAILLFSVVLLSAAAPNIFPSPVLTSFFAFLSVGLGARFIGAVYSVQEPERREALRIQQAADNAARNGGAQALAPIITAAGVETVSTGVEGRGNTPIIIPSDQDVDAEIAENNSPANAPLLPTTNRSTPTEIPVRPSAGFGSTYIKFVFTLTVIMLLSLSAISWPEGLRTAYVYIMSFLYLSFWLPQIHRNAIRNCRKALLWKYIIGQSVLRLLPFAYFFLMEENIIFSETDWAGFCVLAGWLWIQILVLVAQEILGPRWGLPKSWTTEGWDYHPILREDNVEHGGLPIGLVQIPSSPTLERVRTGDSEGTRKKKDDGVRTVDCAICMQVLEVPVVAAGEDISSASAAGGVAGLLARRQYMVTPCRHVFHSACLEGWMRFRLQCPICRENLPPL